MSLNINERHNCASKRCATLYNFELQIALINSNKLGFLANSLDNIVQYHIILLFHMVYLDLSLDSEEDSSYGSYAIT